MRIKIDKLHTNVQRLLISIECFPLAAILTNLFELLINLFSKHIEHIEQLFTAAQPLKNYMQTTLAECCASFMAQCSHTNHVSIKRIRLNVITGGNIFENVKLSNIRDMTHQDNRSNSCFYYNVVGPLLGG